MAPTLELVERKIEIPSGRVLAKIQAGSFDPKARTFTIVFSAGGVFQRYSFMRDEIYEQQLDVREEACDLSRLKGGAPFLLDHRDTNVATNVLGTHEDAWIRDGLAYARIRASGRPEFAGVLADIADGILQNVSTGADIFESREISAPDAKIRRFLATRWKPFESSLVVINADENAVVLARDKLTHPCTVFLSSAAMDETANTGTAPVTTARAATPPATPPAAGTNTETPAAIAPAANATVQAAAQTAAGASELIAVAERDRVLEIQRAGTRLGVDPATITRLVKEGIPLDKARAAMIDAAAAKDDVSATRSQVHVGREPADGMRAAMETYLLNRGNPGLFPLTDKDVRAKTYVGCSMVDLARECLKAKGLRAEGISRMDIVTAALQTTSDFPELLANVGSKNLRKGYMMFPSAWREFVRIVPVADFKQIASISLGDGPKLLKVGEHSEFKSGPLLESAEKYKVETYGRIVGISRQAIVNDDLDAFSRIPQIMGAAAGEVVADLVFGILTANANMADGVPLFHASHGNLGVQAVTVNGMTEMRVAMRKQTGPNGHLINVAPKFVIVPAALETVALQLLSGEIMPTVVTGVNPFRGTAQVIVDARLDAVSATVWYAVADPNQMDGIQVSFLEGQDEGPSIESRAGFEVDGVEIRARMDVGAKAVEWKGLWKSAGTTP